jgi:hypothetical protein
LISAITEEVTNHLLLKILARLAISEVQAILVDESLLVFQPFFPRLL